MSVMEELKMSPEDQLIRVGGMTKSDALKDLTLFSRLEKATRRGNGGGNLPETFLQDYHSCSHKLRKVKHVRFTLRDVFITLGNSDGVIDLHGLMNDIVIREDYMADCGLDLAEVKFLQSLHQGRGLWKFFGLENRIYLNPDFKPYIRLSAMFNSKFQEPPPPPDPSTEMEEPENVEDEDGEDYDLAELMANRIEELEHELSEVQGNRCIVPYLIGSATIRGNIYQCNGEISQARKILEDPNPSAEALYNKAMAQDSIEFNENQKVKFKNISNFLREVMLSYKNGRIPLPTVTPEIISLATTRLETGTSTEKNFAENWVVYLSILEKIKSKILLEVIELEKNILEQNKRFREVENYGYGLLLKRAKFVGMTTTGAAKYNSILHMMKSRMG